MAQDAFCDMTLIAQQELDTVAPAMEGPLQADGASAAALFRKTNKVFSQKGVVRFLVLGDECPPQQRSF